MKIVGLNHRKIRYLPCSNNNNNGNKSANERVEKEAKSSKFNDNKLENERIEKKCKIKSLLMGGNGRSLFLSATGTGTGTGTTGNAYDIQRRDRRTNSSNSYSSSNVVPLRKKSVVNESYNQWNNNRQGTRSYIVNKSHNDIVNDTETDTTTTTTNSTKQEEKKKKKKRVSTNGNMSSTSNNGSSSMKEKEIKKKKMLEKKEKLHAATTPYATTIHNIAFQPATPPSVYKTARSA